MLRGNQSAEAWSRPEYLCDRHRNHGTCTNARRIPVDEMNEAVLQVVEQHVFTPQAIAQVVALTERDDAREQQDALVREHKDVAKRIDRWVQIIETAGDITTAAKKLRELEARRTVIEGQLRSLLPLPRLPRRVIEDRLAEWRPPHKAAPCCSAYSVGGLSSHPGRTLLVVSLTVTTSKRPRGSTSCFLGLWSSGLNLLQPETAVPSISAPKIRLTSITGDYWSRRSNCLKGDWMHRNYEPTFAKLRTHVRPDLSVIYQ